MVCGTGFLVKLFIPSKDTSLYGLVTNNHVLNSEFLQNNTPFNISMNNKLSENITPNNNSNFIFTSELIDVTFIQLTEDKFIKNPDLVFFEPSSNPPFENELIYVIQYPKANLSFASGKIKSITGFNYFHTASTNSGSSGSSIINQDMKSIGIHKSSYGKKTNVATKFSIVEYAIHTLYEKSYINNIEKARKPAKELSNKEKKE